jgi:coenzyme F420-0:L-glutamate ligase/coenzyme F420-1:gamma-L-glutamate ligase
MSGVGVGTLAMSPAGVLGAVVAMSPVDNRSGSFGLDELQPPRIAVIARTNSRIVTSNPKTVAMRKVLHAILALVRESLNDPAPSLSCAPRLELQAVPGLPVVKPGDDPAALIEAALRAGGIALESGDVLVVTSKLLSRAEGRFVDLQTVSPSARAESISREVDKDPRVVELILRESLQISRRARGVLVVRHRLGFIAANASIDLSNAQPEAAPPGSGPWALLLPEAPDRSAEQIRAHLERATGAAIGVVVSDSLGRPFRLGTVGAAVGVAGVPALWDRRGEPDLFGRRLEHTITALADQLAAAADLVAGQADEARPVIHIRGLKFPVGAHAAGELYRSPDEDLYA